jgi:hypothetical protein
MVIQTKKAVVLHLMKEAASSLDACYDRIMTERCFRCTDAALRQSHRGNSWIFALKNPAITGAGPDPQNSTLKS